MLDRKYEFFFFFNDTATTEIYTLSLHDALPISEVQRLLTIARRRRFARGEVVFHQHDPADTLHLIDKGRFAVRIDRKSTRLNSSHANISYAVFCLKKKKPTLSSYLAQIITTSIF